MGIYHRPSIHRAHVSRRNRGVYEAVACQCTRCGEESERRAVDLRKGRVTCGSCGGNVVDKKLA